jgi:hypothetical protein
MNNYLFAVSTPQMALVEVSVISTLHFEIMSKRARKTNAQRRNWSALENKHQSAETVVRAAINVQSAETGVRTEINNQGAVGSLDRDRYIPEKLPEFGPLVARYKENTEKICSILRISILRLFLCPLVVWPKVGRTTELLRS